MKITLGKFEEGQAVRRKRSSRRGQVIQVNAKRVASVLVHWAPIHPGAGASKSWHKPTDLVQVVTTEGQPPVGPGGWLLDTSGSAP